MLFFFCLSSFSHTKSENKQMEQVLPKGSGVLAPVGKGRWQRKGVGG
jgi:hypothetical protein